MTGKNHIINMLELLNLRIAQLSDEELLKLTKSLTKEDYRQYVHLEGLLLKEKSRTKNPPSIYQLLDSERDENRKIARKKK